MSPRIACLTCRARKARCDGLAPQCTTCNKLKHVCRYPKYEPALVWLQPQVDGSTDSEIFKQAEHIDRGLRHTTRGREPLLSDSNCARYVTQLISTTTNTSVEDLLEQIDAFSGLDDTKTHHSGFFSVFKVASTDTFDEDLTEASPYKSAFQEGRGSPKEFDQQSAELDPEATLNTGDEDLLLFSDQHIYSDHDFETSDIEVQYFPIVHEQFSLPTHHVQYLPDDRRPLHSLNHCSKLDMPTYALTDSILSMPTLHGLDVSSLSLHWVQILLNRYQNTFVTSFLPVPKHHTSPWKVLHVPKVYEVLGELVVRGDSSNAKVALLFAVLSAAAFHIDTQRRSPDEANCQWRMLGISYRASAEHRLRLSLATMASGNSTEDLTDIMLSLMSMYTACLSSGNMHKVHTYLSEVSRMNTIYQLDTSYVSNDLEMLQSIFQYSRILQNSIYVYSGRQIYQRQVYPMAGLAGMENRRIDDVQEIAVAQDLFKTNDQYVNINTNGIGSQQCSTEICLPTFEGIFSLPTSLFDLVARVTAVIEECKKTQYQETISDHATSQPILVRIHKLETDIWDWNSRNFDYDHNQDRTIPRQCGIDAAYTVRESTEYSLQHFLQSMKSALLVLFYRCVKDVDSIMIQYLVDEALAALTRCLEMRVAAGDPSSAVAWPLFIVSCEALQPRTRKRAMQIFAQETVRTGMLYYRIAAQAVVAVWEERDRTNNRNLHWSKVLKENAMLDHITLS